MFFKKGVKKNKEKIITEKKEDNTIRIIPDIFYGGNDPLIYRKEIKTKNFRKTGVVSENDKNRAGVKRNGAHDDLGFFSKKKIIVFSIFFLLCFLGISLYYFKDYFINYYNSLEDNSPVVVNNEVDNKIIEKEIDEEIIDNDVEIQPIVEDKDDEEVILEGEDVDLTDRFFLDFPKFSNFDSVDLDSDDLTDVEEELFGIDSGNSDSDGDGYYDGQEIFNLYNPDGLAPVKIIDSGLVLEYYNPLWKYRVYYPSNWEIGLVDKEYKQILFSSVKGDYVEIRVVEKEKDFNFETWFAKEGENQKITDLLPFDNRFNLNGKRRKDSLVAYFEDKNLLVILIYHTSDENFVFFRHVMQMMYQSFRLSNTNIDIPKQPIVPNTEENNLTDNLEEDDSLLVDDGENVSSTDVIFSTTTAE